MRAGGADAGARVVVCVELGRSGIEQAGQGEGPGLGALGGGVQGRDRAVDVGQRAKLVDERVQADAILAGHGRIGGPLD